MSPLFMHRTNNSGDICESRRSICQNALETLRTSREVQFDFGKKSAISTLAEERLISLSWYDSTPISFSMAQGIRVKLNIEGFDEMTESKRGSVFAVVIPWN